MNWKFEYKHAFLLIYFLMMVSVMLDVAGGFSFSSILRKSKYIFIVLGILLYLGCSIKMHIKSISGIIVWTLFFVHTLLWGTIFINESVKAYTTEHVEQMLWYLIILLIIVMSVIKYKNLDEFVDVSYVAVSCVVLWAFIRHMGEVRHPKFWISALGITDLNRWKATFGFMDANFCGYYCMAVIAISFLIIDRWRRQNRFYLKRKRVVLLLMMDIIAGIMLLSSGSRSNILATGLIVWFYVYLYPGIFGRRYAVIVRTEMNFIMCGVLVAVLLIGGNKIGSYIWANSNRAQNIEVNFEAFKKIGSWFTGMGYVENDYFSRDIWGYDTWNIDMYYQYIFFATGILGIIIIGLALFVILCKLLLVVRQSGCPVILIIYFSMLFNAFWQVNICTYRFYPSLILMSILLITMSIRDNKRYKRRGY